MKYLILLFLLPISAIGQSNLLLTSSNTQFSITNWLGSNTVNSLSSLPIGTLGYSATGEVGLKIIPAGGSLPVTVSGSGGGTLTPAGSTVTTNGTTASGLHSLNFIFYSSFTGTVATIPFNGAADSSYAISAPSGSTINGVPYVVTSGSMRIGTQ